MGWTVEEEGLVPVRGRRLCGRVDADPILLCLSQKIDRLSS